MYLQSLFYFPSTIAWLDDDTSFIEVTSMSFQKEREVKAFYLPEDCLNFFEVYSPPLAKIPFLQGSTKHEYYETLEHTPVDFNVLSISQLLQYEKRHQEISVLIVDLNMPGINGVEVLKRLKHLPMKKILLTGESDHQLAVSAFNDNIVDRFILKSSPTLMNELKQYITILEQQYFCDYTHPLLAHLETENKTPLSDPIWINFFANWRQQNGICEYYLIDKTGSFLCIDENKKQYYFLLNTEHTLESFVQSYQEEDNVDLLLKEVESRKKIPFFGFGKEAWQFESNQWEPHFYPCETFQGRELYYWHVISVD